MQNNNSYNLSFNDINWNTLRGPIPFRMSNDYLFRAIMQRRNCVLKGLICSLLHLNPETVSSVLIQNPIELGETIDSKNYILDIKVDLDNRMVINLEMQVVNEHNWTERSLCYLCRSFDNLNRGEDYDRVRPAAQIGILDFPLFPDDPEFYATYQLLNIKNHKLYSDKIRISVLELNQVKIATEEDILYHLDDWARFFKASTWRKLYMISKNNTILQEAAAATYQLSQEEKIRQQCEAREDYYRRVIAKEIRLQKTIEEVERLKAQLDRLNAERAQFADERKQFIAEQKKSLSENQRLHRLLAENGIDPGSPDSSE